IYNTDNAASATGTLSLDNASLQVTGGILQAGQLYEGARGSSVNGTVNIGGDAGTVGQLLIVGDVAAYSPEKVGNVAQGELTVDGGLNLAGGTSVYIGTTVGADRAVEGSTTYLNQATGAVEIGGTLDILGNINSVSIGTTTNGVADGSLRVGTLAMGSNSIGTLWVGTSNLGQATGTLIADSGDLLLDGGLVVGRTGNGTAHGTLQLGGMVQGDNTGSLSVGTVFGGGANVSSAVGEITAAGVSGFSSYEVGKLVGSVGAGSVAQGTVIGSDGGGTSSNTSSITAGVIFSTDNAASATGTLSLADASLQVTGGWLQAGHLYEGARGSSANGTVDIGGDAGTVGQYLIVGHVFTTDPSMVKVGSDAQGELTVDGGLNLAGGTSVYIGTTEGYDRAVEGSTTYLNRATGAVEIDGTLGILDDINTVSIGTTTNGVADGSLSVGKLAMGSKSIDSLWVGTSNLGQASGTLSVDSGDLRVDNGIYIGNTSGGSAEGTVALTGTTLTANRVLAGYAAGFGRTDATANIDLHNVAATIFDTFDLFSGDLLLDSSLLKVGNTATFGNAATLTIDIEGCFRGTQYGAIDAGWAFLDGDLVIDFSGFVPFDDSMVFDLVRSGALDGGITNDFSSLQFIDLQSGYSAIAGIAHDDVDIYRLTVTRQTVPEPGTLLLMMIGLVSLLLIRFNRLRIRRRYGTAGHVLNSTFGIQKTRRDWGRL
ncbi:MAG: PEP-CTERM sorting domain-containing protein, partial [Deltaproteobacteria bacterium]|nr:PEP-CTERM sorting domain-containing protein [Deltaproteobacteria bacterium]